MRRNENSETIEGYLFDASKLVKKEGSQKHPDTPYITGEVDVATDENGLNVVPVNFIYVTEFTKNGKKWSTWDVLTRILAAEEDGRTWVKGGKDNALKLKFQPSAALLDYYRQSDDTMQRIQRNDGGFINVLTEFDKPENERNTFKIDVLVVGVKEVEADPDTGTEEYARVNAYIFNTRSSKPLIQTIIPFTFVMKSQAGINYLLEQEPSKGNPLYTQLRGHIENTTQVTKKEVEMAFGNPVVETTEKHIREWVIDACGLPYEFDSEETITKAEVDKLLADRNVYLENQKANSKARIANAATATSSPAPAKTVATETEIPDGGFDF